MATTTADLTGDAVAARELPAAAPLHARLDSIDLLRGLVMILMTLDHTRDFLCAPGVTPVDLAHAGAPLFLTRWITNFCAPVFFLLTGTGAFLSLERRGRAGLARFLLTRGAWLILLELTFLRCLGMQFNFDYHVTLLNVLWALGGSMIVLSALIGLPARWVAAAGIVLIGTHNLLDALPQTGPFWAVLHRPGPLLDLPAHTVFVAYPLIPWVGVTAAGYGLGAVFAWERQARRRWLLGAGLVICALFVALRATDTYGEPMAWSTQAPPLLTVLSFVNTSKYPPSLLFLLMTLGPALLVLWAAEGGIARWLQPAVILGRVPLFFFLLHLPLIHAVAVLVCLVRYGSVHWMFESPAMAQFPFTPPPGWGLSLPLIYLAWVLIVAAMYPACRAFAALKRQHTWRWLSYA